MKQLYGILLSLLLLLPVLPVTAQAAPTLVSGGLGSIGEIESLKVNNDNGVYSSGVMVVGGVEMIIPKNMLIDLPANRLSLQQIFDQAPAACVANGESGLAKSDKCNGSGTGAIATLHAVRTNAGNVIVGDLFIQKAAELVVGVVTYINYDQGYYRVNGLPNDPNTGAMVRLNDPTGRHTIQSGAGCAGGPNCSPDPRFTLDPDNYTNTFATGYPMCIPSTVPRSFTNPLGGPTSSQATADGSGDYLCPDTNRTAALTEPPVADSRRFAPIKVGDSVTAEGNYETIGGVRFLSAHTSTILKALSTSNALGQPDYLFLEEVDIEAPAFQNQRQIAMFIGFTTFAPTDVDIWSLHRDPVTNQTHEFPLASVQGCDISQGGIFPSGDCSSQGIPNGPANTNIFKIIYRDDYQKPYDPKLSPCAHLLASPRFGAASGVCAGGGSIRNDFAVLSPIPHEIIARTGRKIDSATNPSIGELITIDINGNLATNGEYLFPLGLNLGGIGVAEMSEIDLNLLNSPTIFDGIPWNLDRRLGPSGCLNNGGVCEAGALGSAGFALDPFPFSGLDPRTQASGLPTGSYSNPTFSPGTLTNIRNRIFSYVTEAGIFNGDATMLPCATGVFPANCPQDPPLIQINPTPVISILPPIIDEDAATTTLGVPVIIDVVANDFPVFGSIDPTTVTIVTSPASGSAVANGNGTITFTPVAFGTFTFTYTVANNFGSVSLPGTVTVTVVSPATAVALIADKASPQAIGTPITFTAAGSGGSGSYEYRFWLNSGTGYVVAQDYSTINTFIWTPTGTGAYDILVEVRNAGTTVLRDAFKTINFFQITAASTPATAVTLVLNVASPQVVNTPITFTATGSGGSGTYEYRFWINFGAGFLIARNYSTSNTFVWTPTKASIYDIMVEVRNVGSTADREAFMKVFAYRIQPAPATAVSITPDKASPQAPGTPITFTASGSGGSSPYEYRFWLNSGAGYAIVQSYSTLPTWTWTPSATGNFDVLVDVRSVGSTAARDALNKLLFYRIQ